MPYLSPVQNVMVSAARKAGRRLSRDFNEVENLQISMKGPADFVTNADHRTEQMLIEELQRARPGYGFLVEESGVIEGPDKTHRWIIDPLDGTTNFLHGIPQFAISIALERDGQIVSALVFNPVSNELFLAEKGHGAYLNDKRLRVANRKKMNESLFATGIPFLGRGDHDHYIRELSAVMGTTSGVRRFGAASLDLAFTAAGRVDGFWEHGLSPWDVAAGILLVREAGGVVTDFGGGTDMIGRREIVCANEALHPQLLKLIREAGKA